MTSVQNVLRNSDVKYDQTRAVAKQIVKALITVVALSACQRSNVESASEELSSSGSIEAGEVAGVDFPRSEKAEADLAPSAILHEIPVSTVDELRTALTSANPGDAIVLEDGVYRFNSDLFLTRPGTKANRIVVTPRNRGRAVIEHCNTEGFNVAAPYWTFEKLIIKGVCRGSGSENAHAFHITGNGSSLILRRNTVIDFQSHVKLNSAFPNGVQTWPDRATFIGNIWKHSSPMPGSDPHNVLNLDGGNGHIVRDNVFVDLAIAEDINAQSAIYIKAGAKNAIVENNLISCAKRVSSGNTVRAMNSGEASGSGGICNGDCANQNIVYRNNIVMHCRGSGNSAGISVNYEANSFYLHNFIHDVDRNFYGVLAAPSNLFYANLLYRPWVFAGTTRPMEVQNLFPDASGMANIYANPDLANFVLRDGSPIRQKVPRHERAPRDFCGHERAQMTDIGPIDYSHPDAAACVDSIRALYNRI